MAAAPGDGFKLYLDRLLKLVPAEVLSLYLVGKGFIPSDAVFGSIIWAIFCLLATGLAKAYGTSDRNVKPDLMHVALSMSAFAIWVYSLGGPISRLVPYQPYIGSLLILAFTFVVPYFYKGQEDTA